MTPTGAYGLNSSMKDADLLAQYLEPWNLNTIDLTDYLIQRKTEVEKLQAMQIEKEKNFVTQFTIYD